MFYTVSFFGFFGVIKTIHSTHQISGDSADTVKFHIFSYHSVVRQYSSNHVISSFIPAAFLLFVYLYARRRKTAGAAPAFCHFMPEILLLCRF